MQKVIVTIESHKHWDSFMVDEKEIASISEDIRHKGKYEGRVHGFSGFDGCCDNQSYPDALEFVSDIIGERFARLGLDVEFK